MAEQQEEPFFCASTVLPPRLCHSRTTSIAAGTLMMTNTAQQATDGVPSPAVTHSEQGLIHWMARCIDFPWGWCYHPSRSRDQEIVFGLPQEQPTSPIGTRNDG